jgi:hypothetical protein
MYNANGDYDPNGYWHVPPVDAPVSHGNNGSRVAPILILVVAAVLFLLMFIPV